MARLQRLRSQVGRVKNRVSAYREAAEREVARREMEEERRVVGEEDPLLRKERPDSNPPAGTRVTPAGSPSVQEPVDGASATSEAAPTEVGTRQGATPPHGVAVPSEAAGPRDQGMSAAEPGPAVSESGGGGNVPPAPPPRQPPGEALPWGLRVAGEVGWRLLVLAAVVWVLIQVVGAISLLVISFAAGLLIAALLQPITGWLKRMGMARGPATAVTSFTGFGVIGLVGWFVVWQVNENIDPLVESVTDGIDEFRIWLVESPFGVSEEDINELLDGLNSWIADHSDELTTYGLEGVNYLVRFFTGAGVALFVVLFLLYDGRNIWHWCLNFLPASARPAVAGAGPRAWITLTGYVRGTVIVALIDAIGIGIGLYILSVPMAVPLAVIVFLFAFVPIIGAFVSGALAVVVAVVTEGLVTALLVLGVVLLVQQIEGQILQPFILGRLVRVHPLGVVLAVTGGTLLAGIPGAVVAVPLVAVANTVVGYLHAYHREADIRAHPQASGATIASIAPVLPAPPGSPGPDGAPEADSVGNTPDGTSQSPGSAGPRNGEPGGGTG